MMRTMKKRQASGVVVNILPAGIRAEARPGERLDRVLERAGIRLNLYCGGNGLCGKCTVLVPDEAVVIAVNKPGGRTTSASAAHPAGPGFFRRPACQVVVSADLTVYVPESSGMPRIKTVGAECFPSADLDPAVRMNHLPFGGMKVVSCRPSSVSLGKKLGGLFGLGQVEFASKDVLAAASAALRLKRDASICLYDGGTVLDVVEGTSTEGPPCLGLAVDLGTTTVAVELVDLLTGRVLSSAAGLNEQAAYGADVVSRLSYAFQDPAGAQRLRKAAVATINGLAAEAARRAGRRTADIYETVVAGNTAMDHLFAGAATDSLAVLPFAPVFLGLPAYKAADAGLDLNRNAMVWLAPNIVGFVGGDISAGLTALGLAAFPGSAVLIDLGTNGEIVVKKDGAMYASSTAVGPAFEGAAISCGMLAVPGAVEKAEWAGSGFSLRAIGGGRPLGLCGSGLVDVLALALEHGLLRRDGRIEAADRMIHLNGDLSLSQPDIRSVQTALAAVKTGVALTMKEAGLGFDAVDRIFVAGSFGSSLDIGNAMAVGLLPDLANDKVMFVGNASLAGARMMLIDRKTRRTAAATAEGIRHIQLAERPDFQEIFTAGLRFGRYPEAKK